MTDVARTANTGTSGPSASPRTIDPMRLEHFEQELRDQQSLPMAFLAGGVAALAGAGLWAVITVMSGWQIGWMAVGVGFLVGWAVRTWGKGVETRFGAVGALLSFLGCLAGNLFAVCGFAAGQEQLPVTQVIASLTPGIAADLMIETFSPMDLLFYGIAVYEGYKLSIRQLTPEEVARLSS
jgi:hypothetical protein